MTITNNEEKKKNPKQVIALKTTLLLINVVIILFLLNLLFEFGPTPVIIILIFLFAFLTFAGPFFKKKKKSYYSRMFPDKIEARKKQRMQREFIKKRVEPELPLQKNIKAVDLNFEFHKPLKPLTMKCSNCNTTLASFVKKCPMCGKFVGR